MPHAILLCYGSAHCTSSWALKKTALSTVSQTALLDGQLFSYLCVPDTSLSLPHKSLAGMHAFTIFPLTLVLDLLQMTASCFTHIQLLTFTPKSRMWSGHISSVGKLITLMPIWKLLLARVQTLLQPFDADPKRSNVWVVVSVLRCV